MICNFQVLLDVVGTPGGIRTPDLLLRRKLVVFQRLPSRRSLFMGLHQFGASAFAQSLTPFGPLRSGFGTVLVQHQTKRQAQAACSGLSDRKCVRVPAIVLAD